MSFLQLTPNPTGKPEEMDADAAAQSSTDAASSPTEQTASDRQSGIHPLKVRTGRFGELEEHELIHLIDALDDERSRARFRESVYISVLVWVVLAWFLIYGPRVLLHQPVLRDPIAMMKQHDKERLTYLNQPPAPPRAAPVLNQKTIQQIQKEAPPVPKAPVAQQAPAPAPAPPPPQEVAHTTAPPVPQPTIPLPSAPRPTPSVDLPSAPQAKIAPNSQSAHSALQDAIRGAMKGRSGADIGGAPSGGGPLQAGAQILSDVGNWDPSAYMRKLHNDIQRNWDPLIPEEVQAPLMKKGVVGIRFIILRDGQIGDIKLETPSGDVQLDKAAWYAITSEGQFPQLPKEFHGQQLELRIGFFYNQEIPR